MKRLLTLVAFFATLQASAQQVNPVPDYVFRNQMSVGRNAVTDTGAYFSIGPRYGAVKGFMPPIVSDTASVNANKRNGLLIFSVQKNKFLYWDSVRVQWSDMAGSSGSYITGKGITGYVPQFSDTATLDTSALYTLGNQLGVGTSSFAYTGSGRTVVELNGTAGGLYGFKRNDSAKGYLFHNGDNMELANTMAGSISFNTNSATRGSIASDGVWRLHNLAGTGDRVVQASSNGTLSATASVTGLVDTLTISTRAWRQKGDDSLGAIIATKGSGTVTSVATGFGLSGGTITTSGTLLVDTLNISTRAWRQKGLDSLAALEVSGSGTTNYVAKFTAGSTIGNSQIFDNGNVVGINTNNPTINGGTGSGALHIAGTGSNWSMVHYTTDTTGNTGGDGMLVGTFGDRNMQIFNYEAGNISFSTSAAERMRIFANGRIGINTTTDAGDYKLQVAGNIYNTGSAVLAATSGNVGVGTTTPQNDAGYKAVTINGTTGGQIGFYAGGIQQTNMYGDATGLTFVTTAATPMSFLTNSLTRMTIESGGDVGIGTASPTQKLDVVGYIRGTAGFVGNGGLSLYGDNTSTERLFLTTSGNVGIGTASPATILNVRASSATLTIDDSGDGTSKISFRPSAASYAERAFLSVDYGTAEMRIAAGASGGAYFQSFYTNGTERARVNSAGELLINTTSDAGDYKLQVVGNARVGTGKLDIASNTTFGLGVARSGTSEIAGQIYNSNGILYLGAESSAGGQIFTGSSAYAAVIGSGANYPLQFATNNATRATINTNGELLINTTTDNGDFKLQVNGNALVSGSIKTANGSSSTAQPWHLGSVVATSVQLDTNNYVEVEINGVYYRLAIVTPL